MEMEKDNLEEKAASEKRALSWELRLWVIIIGVFFILLSIPVINNSPIEEKWNLAVNALKNMMYLNLIAGLFALSDPAERKAKIKVSIIALILLYFVPYR